MDVIEGLLIHCLKPNWLKELYYIVLQERQGPSETSEELTYMTRNQSYLTMIWGRFPHRRKVGLFLLSLLLCLHFLSHTWQLVLAMSCHHSWCVGPSHYAIQWWLYNLKCGQESNFKTAICHWSLLFNDPGQNGKPNCCRKIHWVEQVAMCQHCPIPPLVSGNLATLKTSKPLVLFSLIMTYYFPHRWKDLTAYKLPIFHTYCQFSGRVWLGYDQAFCQYVAAVELVKLVSNEWSSIQFSCQWGSFAWQTEPLSQWECQHLK